MYQKKHLHEKILQLMLMPDEVKAKIEAKMIAKHTSEESCGKETLPSLRMELYMMDEKFEEAVNNLRGLEKF